MKMIVFVLIFCLCFELGYGAVFDPYQRRYNIRNASFDALFPTTVSVGFQKLINSSTVIDNTRCKSIYQFTTSSTLAQLVNFHHELVDLCPQLYDTIWSKNVSTWGPVDEFMQIWYMRHVDALWIKIQARTCRCQLYDDFVAGARAASDSALQQYLETNYDNALCLINTDTMYKWNLFLNQPAIKNRAIKFIRIGAFSISIVHEIAKAYLTAARYNMYLEGPPFLLNSCYNATFASSNWTLTTKGFIKQMMNYHDQKYPALNLVARQNDFLMKRSEALDLSWSYYREMNKIPLDTTDEIHHLHLILYLCRKDFLEAKRLQYASSSTTPICTTTAKSTPSTSTSTTRTTTTTPTTTTTTSTTPSTTSPTTSTTTLPPTTTSACPPSFAAGLFIGNGVVLTEGSLPHLGKKEPVCKSEGLSYYDGNTPVEWQNVDGNEAAGFWDRTDCPNACACTASACYKVITSEFEDPRSPLIYFYPHCNSSADCFVTVIFFIGGSIENPSDPTDKYSFDSQTSFDVNDPNYPKVTKIGCNGCPVVT